MNIGSFSDEILEDIYSFTRCKRPDGSTYGSRGKCRKGLQIGYDTPKQEPSKPVATTAKKSTSAPKAVEAEAKPQSRLPKVETSEDYARLVQSSQRDLAALKAHREARKLEKGGKSALRKQFEERMGGRKQADDALTEITNFGSLYYAGVRAAQRGDKSAFSDARQMSEYKEKAKTIETAVRAMPKPDVEKYRGISTSNSHLKGLIRQAKSGGSFQNDALDSWSTNLRIADQFSSERANAEFPNSVVFRTRNKQGASIRPFSAVAGEDEILTPSGSKYRFTGYRVVDHDGKKVHMFDLEEE